MHNPLVRAGIGQSMIWNKDRNSRIALIRAGIHPGIEAVDDFYPVSFHNTMNGAYAVQNRVRATYPDLKTCVKKVDGKEWVAEIRVRLRTSEEMVEVAK